MRIVHLVCRGCGAPMEMKARHIRRIQEIECSFCGSRAFVREEPERAEAIIANPKLRSLDARWRRERREFETVDRYGRVHVPSREVGQVSIAIGIVLGFVGTLMRPGGVLIGLAFLVPFGVAGIVQMRRAASYKAARARYHRRRREIIGAGGAPTPSGRRRWRRRRRRRRG